MMFTIGGLESFTKGIKVAAMLDDVHYRWFGIIPKGIKVAAMLDDVH